MTRRAARVIGIMGLCLWPFQTALSAEAITEKPATKKLDEPCALAITATTALDKSLQILARRCNISIAYSAAATRGFHTQPSVEQHSPALTPRQWLTAWLSPATNLTFSEVGDAAVSVTATKPLEPNDSRLNHQANNTATPKIEEMLVTSTGTHLLRYNADIAAVSPLPSILLADQGLRGLWQTLRYSPLVSAGSSSHRLGSDGNGSASVALRGLPANNTLVLIDGTRTAGNGFSGDTVDLNSIPSAALERIDILKNSASAIYGSEAVAGAVNFITRRNVEGVTFKQTYGQSSRHDMHSSNSELLTGTITDFYSAYIAARYFYQDGAMNHDRELSSSVDARTQGGIDRRSSASANSHIYLPSGAVISAADNGGFQWANGDDFYDYARDTNAISPLQQAQLFGRINFAVTDTLELDTRITYSKNTSSSEHAPTPIETAFESTPLTISADNRYNPFAIELADVRRRITELGRRSRDNNSEYWRINSSLERLASNQQRSSWKANLHWSQSSASSHSKNLVNATHLAQGIGDQDQCLGKTVDGCTAINLLGPAGSIDTEQVNFLRAEQKNSGRSEIFAASYDINLQPWAWRNGDFLVAAGLEGRYESGQQSGDEAAFIGGSQPTLLNADRKIFEAYTEINVPLLRDYVAADLLQLELAMRYSHYSDFGEQYSPKAGLVYKPHSAWQLRADYTEGFRAPSLIELYHSDAYSRTVFADPCSNPELQSQLPGCTQLADPRHSQYRTHIHANRQLQPEQTKSRAFGIKYSPQALHQFSFGIDYFQLEQNNVITALNPTLLAWRDALGMDDGLVKRDSRGNIQVINSYAINGEQRRLEGFDYNLSLQGPAFGGYQYNFYSQATQMKNLREYYPGNLESNNIVGSFVDVNSSGYGALPEWKALAGVALLGEHLDLHLSGQYLSALKENIPRSNQTRAIDSWLIYNAKVNVRTLAQRLQIEIGIDNLFDTPPPFSAAATNNNFDARSHDISGRFYFANVSFQFE